MQDIKRILEGLKIGDWWERKKGIESLLSYPENLYLNTLEEWLRNGDDALARNISMEIYRTLGERALKSLIPFLKDEDADVRVFAANLLGDIKDNTAVPALISSMDDPDVNVRMASAEALGKIGDEGAVDALARAAGEIQWMTMACIEAIGEIGGRKALSILHMFLKIEGYRGMALAAIEKAGNYDSIKHLAPYVGEGETGSAAIKAIVEIAEREKKTPPTGYFIYHIPLLLSLQNSPQPDIRKAAFAALSWLEDMRGLPYFIGALNDEDLQENAIKGIMAIGKAAATSLCEALKKPGGNRIVLAKLLSMFGECDALLEFADDEDAEVRTEVALAIGGINSRRARKALSVMERDSAEEVRAAAKISLKKYDEEFQA